MRVVYLAAGAGGMICGSCLRDNRLAAELIRQGRDLHFWPMYTPLKADEPVVGDRRVRYGGINVYLQQVSRVFAHLPGPIARGLDSVPLLRLAGRFAGRTQADDLGPLTVSVLAGEHGRQHRELDRLISDLRALRPDLVNLPNLMFLGQARRIRRELDVPVLCTLSGEDIFLDALPQPHRGTAFRIIAERAADVDAYIAVTRYFADHAAAHFALPRDRIHVIPMGIHAPDFARVSAPPDDPFTIGYFARICPEKGLDRLAGAFIALHAQGRRARLRIGGYTGPADRAYLEGVMQRLRDAGLQSSVELCGEVDREQKIALLRSLHVLSVPTVYPEAKGFYILEALAAGAAVVQPRHGSFPELVAATGGGVLYDPADEQALVAQLAGLMDDRTRLAELARQGSAAVARDFTAARMAAETWTLYERFAARASRVAPGCAPG